MPPDQQESIGGKPWLTLLVCLTIAYAFNFVTLQAANKGLEFWFQTLPRQPWTLPTILFAPVWTIANGLTGISAWKVYHAEPSEHGGHKVRALALVAAVLLFNTVWAWLFFNWHTIMPAVFVAGLTTLAAFATVWAGYRVRPVAGTLLLPIFLWTVYLAALNISVPRT